MRALKSFLEMPFSGRQRKLASTRPQTSKANFIEGAAATDLGRIAAASLWDRLNEIKVVQEFSPSPEDDLFKVYGLAEEDLDEDVVLSLIEEVGVTVPTKERLDRFGVVKTPRDIVRLIEACDQIA